MILGQGAILGLLALVDQAAMRALWTENGQPDPIKEHLGGRSASSRV
jgi:hypothetical protein